MVSHQIRKTYCAFVVRLVEALRSKPLYSPTDATGVGEIHKELRGVFCPGTQRSTTVICFEATRTPPLVPSPPLSSPFPSLQRYLLRGHALGRHSARLVRRGGIFGLKGGAGRALLGSRVGAAARAALEAAGDLSLACEEGTAHFVPETMVQVGGGMSGRWVGGWVGGWGFDCSFL